jgi:beta-glucosidase
LFGTTQPLYPFGFGLSYTSFDISPPRILTPTIAATQPARIAVDVANTGGRAGDEVVQLYIHDDEASVTRPVIQLKRFQRVTLAPGERRTITFELTPDDLALWNADMKRVVEPGTFTISVGANSVNLKSAKLTVTG